MNVSGITITKETNLYKDRSTRSMVKEILPSATPLLVIEEKYREGKNWLEVKMLNETKTKGYILKEKPTQISWPKLENAGSNLPLLERINGQLTATKKELRKGKNFYLINNMGVYASIYFQHKTYYVVGQLNVKQAEEWTPTSIILALVGFACLMYGAFVIAPEMLAPGRYPRIVFFLPGLALAAVVVPVVWGIIYAGKEIMKRT